jgi:SAM-dependent methyltransferase
MRVGARTSDPCRICGAAADDAGTMARATGAAFLLRRCPDCGYAFVLNPLEDSGRVYDECYYRGQGADPYVDYLFELERPASTVRRLEWEGILEVVRNLVPLGPGLRWLDYGCGNGGLVRHLRASGACEATGFETGWIADRARALGIPLLDQAGLRAATGQFDVVTAIEVVEHLVDPLQFFRLVRALLKPGGLFFLTTGNAARHEDLTRWSYVVPEIHVSFFEPRTVERALRMTGFRAESRGHLPGFEKIIGFKILKRLGVRRYNRALDALPWRPISRLVDARLSLTAHPVGWAV